MSVKKSKLKRVAVVGGGASGLIAAIAAARRGAEVTVFEKQKAPGRKILASGNGQCNISNRNVCAERYHGAPHTFVETILERFTLEDTEAFFASLGIPLREGEKGKLYPYTLQARTVLEALLFELTKCGAVLNLHRRVDSLFAQKNGEIKLITAGKEEHRFDAVILALGGRSYSSLGGSKRGYELLEKLGHSVSTLLPAIVAITIPSKRLHSLEGIKWDVGLKAILATKGEVLSSSFGELLFTKYGISGPVTLDVSTAVNRSYSKGQSVSLSIDLFPHSSAEELVSFLSVYAGDRTVLTLLNNILKYRMAAVALFYAGAEHLSGKTFDQLSNKEMELLVGALKDMRLEAGEPRSFEEATVTAGGVSHAELDPYTMESKKVKNVYICGELLDVDGDCGGYNLQFAWSSGHIAGEAAVKQ